MTTVFPALDQRAPYPVTTFGYYKGTPAFPAPPELVKLVFTKGIAEELKVLTAGGMDTDAKKIAAMKTYLDALNDECIADQKRDPSTVGTPVDAFATMERVWGTEWKTHWWRWHTCIGALLQLGGIKNDDDNGWLVVKQHKASSKTGGWEVLDQDPGPIVGRQILMRR